MGRGVGFHFNRQVLENPLVNCGALTEDSASWEDLFIHFHSFIHHQFIQQVFIEHRAACQALVYLLVIQQ